MLRETERRQETVTRRERDAEEEVQNWASEGHGERSQGRS